LRRYSTLKKGLEITGGSIKARNQGSAGENIGNSIAKLKEEAEKRFPDANVLRIPVSKLPIPLSSC